MAWGIRPPTPGRLLLLQGCTDRILAKRFDGPDPANRIRSAHPGIQRLRGGGGVSEPANVDFRFVSLVS